MTNFEPPTDWEPVYASSPQSFYFGEDASQIARLALHWFTVFGGDPAESLALDLGSGEGRDTAFLAEAGFSVTARDIAPTGLEKTRDLLARRGIAATRVDLAPGDVREFSYLPAAYDLALAANVYQFLSPAEAPAHIRRLQTAVRPGGICGMGVFSPAMLSWGANLGNCYTATADELAAFFSRDAGWLLLDRTEYWTYRMAEETMVSFAYVVARKVP